MSRNVNKQILPTTNKCKTIKGSFFITVSNASICCGTNTYGLLSAARFNRHLSLTSLTSSFRQPAIRFERKFFNLLFLYNLHSSAISTQLYT